MDRRLYPVMPEFFAQTILPLIEGRYIWKGRPPLISHYQVFCAILDVLRVGCPWRDLPKCYGNWHSIYTRFKRGSERGLWWHILITLQHGGKAKVNIVLADSTTFKIHRHGGGAKGGSIAVG
jgi:transposase